MVYRPVSGSHFSQKDADTIGPILQRLDSEKRLTAEDVKEEARPKDSPLHAHVFACSREAAAEKYYTAQAGLVIRSIQIVKVDASGKDREVRAFHHVRFTEGDETTSRYTAVENVLSDEEKYEYVVRQVLTQLRTAQRTLSALKGMKKATATVTTAIAEVEAEVAKKGRKRTKVQAA